MFCLGITRSAPRQTRHILRSRTVRTRAPCAQRDIVKRTGPRDKNHGRPYKILKKVSCLAWPFTYYAPNIRLRNAPGLSSGILHVEVRPQKFASSKNQFTKKLQITILKPHRLGIEFLDIVCKLSFVNLWRGTTVVRI